MGIFSSQPWREGLPTPPPAKHLGTGLGIIELYKWLSLGTVRIMSRRRGPLSCGLCSGWEGYILSLALRPQLPLSDDVEPVLGVSL